MIKKEKTSEASMRPPQRGDVPILNFKTGHLPYQGGGHGPVSVDYSIYDYPCCCCSFNLPLCRMLLLWFSFKTTFACLIIEMMYSSIHWINHYSADKYY